jgi:hypothetical protein
MLEDKAVTTMLDVTRKLEKRAGTRMLKDINR